MDGATSSVDKFVVAGLQLHHHQLLWSLRNMPSLNTRPWSVLLHIHVTRRSSGGNLCLCTTQGQGQATGAEVLSKTWGSAQHVYAHRGSRGATVNSAGISCRWGRGRLVSALMLCVGAGRICFSLCFPHRCLKALPASVWHVPISFCPTSLKQMPYPLHGFCQNAKMMKTSCQVDL